MNIVTPLMEITDVTARYAEITTMVPGVGRDPGHCIGIGRATLDSGKMVYGRYAMRQSLDVSVISSHHTVQA